MPSNLHALKPFLAHIYGAPLKEWVMTPTMSGNLCLRLQLMDQGKASTINIGNLMHKDFWFVGSTLSNIYRARLLSEKYPDAVHTAMRGAIAGALGETLIAAGGSSTYLYRTVNTLNSVADFGADPCYWIPETVRDTRHNCSRVGKFELVQLLLERGGVVTNGSLKYAIRSGDLNLVNFMLSHSFMALGQTGSVLKKSEWFRLYSSDSERACQVDAPPTSESMLSPEAFEFLRSICSIRFIP
ncbi:hypothetical protein BC829DRAFT_405224 [Chytridium lagenaria]|nr:hypothetical protein BC829DRAFT_405224 [Chytridium lagenaria]